MAPDASLLVVGAGQAGAELALATRAQGWAGPITLLGNEALLPYHRPPLSKAFLQGQASAESLQIRPAAVYQAARVGLRLGVRVERIDRVARQVQLADGSQLPYSRLALCTGGRPRTLDLAGLPRDRPTAGLHCLRTQVDALAIRQALVPGARLVVVGGGYVGLEVAASARQLGAEVTVLEAQPRVLARVTSPLLSDFYAQLHRDAGVQVHTGVQVLRVDCRDGRVHAVVCDNGQRLAADLLVVGVGMQPEVALAASAGLAVDGGIVVDALSQTSDPDIVAAGDCTVQDSALYQRRIRLESVPNALEQARAAASLLTGQPRPHHAVPWFWSDQHGLKLQMVGLSEGHDQVVLRGALAGRSFLAFYLRQGVLIAADAVNRPADFMLAKRLVAAAATVPAAVLADEARPLKALLPTPSA